MCGCERVYSSGRTYIYVYKYRWTALRSRGRIYWDCIVIRGESLKVSICAVYLGGVIILGKSTERREIESCANDLRDVLSGRRALAASKRLPHWRHSHRACPTFYGRGFMRMKLITRRRIYKCLAVPGLCARSENRPIRSDNGVLSFFSIIIIILSLPPMIAFLYHCFRVL